MSSRADFLKKTFRILGGVFAETIHKRLPDAVTNRRKYIFPPGAVDNFIDICTTCGDCLPVCPEKCIKIITDEITGKLLPAIIPHEKACVMCEHLACIQHCEPKALVAPDDLSFPKIGLAVFNKSACLPYNGQTCMTCFDACPLKRKAIVMISNKPIIDEEFCTGCGICENVCVLSDPKGITIIP